MFPSFHKLSLHKLSPYKFKVISFALLSLSFIWAIDVAAEDISSLPKVTIIQGLDLAADGEQANKKNIPILMFFSMKHCPFCFEVEEDYLKPMLRNAEYDNKVIIRKIKIDSVGDMRDFKGNVRDIEEFGDVYNVSMVPTLVLVDAQGNRLSPSIIGIANKHYYSSELDTAIDASTQKMRAIAKR
ncbi:MAG: thioredoxin fold domain-containing protein [Woeseiaceae bacterium]